MQDFSIETDRILRKLKYYDNEGKKIFATSSFQTQSVVLLHILSRSRLEIPIFFINTGFHFAETLVYRDQLAEYLGLNVIDLLPFVPKSEQLNKHGEFRYISDPDRCCQVNKVEPLKAVISQYDVWISGIRKEQTETRKRMNEEEVAGIGIIRYHPMLEWTGEMIESYIESFNLPAHSLAPHFSISIGCEPCTHLTKVDDEKAMRWNRWAGMNKEECGLHTELGADK